MQVENKYISVKEFAERENISTQAVYKRLGTTLQPYVIKQGKITYIDYDAYTSQNKGLETSQSKEQEYKRLYAEQLDKVAELQRLYNVLQTESAEKERQYISDIKELTAKHAETVTTLTEQLAALSIQNNELTAAVREAHALNAATLAKLTPPEPEEQPEPDPPSFWKRLFGKK